MATNTSNYNLKKPSQEDFYNIEDQNANMDIIDAQLKSEEEALATHLLDYVNLSKTIKSGAIQSPAINLGSNTIRVPDVSVSPKIEFSGMSYVNLLGKDGNCEDVSTWASGSNVTNTLDVANKVFGNNAMKCAITSGTQGWAGAVINVVQGHTYFLSAYIRNGNATSVAGNIGGYGNFTVKQTISMQRVATCITYTGTLTTASVNIIVNGTTGQYTYFDGVMVLDLTIMGVNSENYTIAQLLAKYPYVDSYGSLTNPYFENRRYNLVRNGNCEEGVGYWETLSNATFGMENNKFKVVTVLSGWGTGQAIKVKPNTSYYLSGNVSGNTHLIILTAKMSGDSLQNGVGTFNTGVYDTVWVYMLNDVAGTGYVDSIMLVEGTTAPTSYLSCDLQRYVVEGQFTQDDKIIVDNGKVSGDLWWKHRTLYGMNFDWQFYADFTGYKAVHLDINSNFNSAVANGLASTATGIKYDGKVLKSSSSMTNITDELVLNKSYNTSMFLELTDIDSGWTETINPNNDEVKAFMNGWRAVSVVNSRYCAWISLIDKLPPTGFYSTLAANTVVGQYSITVADGTKFKVGRKILICDATTGLAIYGTAVTNIVGNVISTANQLDAVYTVGLTAVSGDDGVSDTTQLNYCKNNVAPNYEGYRLHYKLATPEPITDANTHVHGEIWDLVKGDNYINIDSGIVLGEVVNPILYSGMYYVNIHGNVAISNGGELRHAAESFIEVNKNQIFDTTWELNIPSTTAFGGKYARIVQTNYDANAVYTVDYQILKTLHSQSFGSLAISYTQSILATLEDHSKEIEQKQKHDSVLDTLIDLSMYEACNPNMNNNILGRFGTYGVNDLRLYYSYKLVPKKCVPIVTITAANNGQFFTGTSGTDIVPLDSWNVSVSSATKDYLILRIQYTGANSTIQSALLNNMGTFFVAFTADCRGRI